MKRLTKTEEKRFCGLLADLDDAQDELRASVETFHEKRTEAFGKLQAAIEEYNSTQEELFNAVETAREDVKTALEEIDSFRDGIAGDLAIFYDEKSEKWRESDAGSAFSEWKDKWDSMPEVDLSEIENSPSEIEVEEPDELNLDLEESFCESVASELPLDVEGNDTASPEVRRPAPRQGGAP